MLESWIRVGATMALLVAACGGVSRGSHDDGAGSAAVGGSGATVDAGGKAGSAPRAGGRDGSTDGGRSARGGRSGSAASSGTGTIDAGGTAPVGGCLTDAESLQGASFDVVMPAVEDLGIPTVVHFERTNRGKVSALFGVPGHATVVVPTVRETDAYGDALHFEEFVLSSGSHAEVMIQTLDLCVSASDGATVTGVGSHEVNVFHGDYYDTTVSDFRLKGGPDTTPPELYPPYAPVDPLAPPIVRASEPLAPDGTVRLAFGPERELELELEPVEEEGVVVAYRIPQVLPLGISAKANADAVDLAAHSLPSDELLMTVEDPGVQPLDGFESSVNASTVTRVSYSSEDAGDAVVITGAGVIEGAQSLEIGPGLKVLFHFTRPQGMGALSLRLRAWNGGAFATGVKLRAGLIGGSNVAAQDVELPVDSELGEGGATGAAGAAGASSTGVEAAAVQQVTLSLPDAGDEVLFTIETPYLEESELTAAWAIIDDVVFLPIGVP
jgi:hypothetical protein